MRFITAAIVTAILLGGCASTRDRMFYEKPGVSEEEMRADEAACTRAALDTAGQRGAAFLSVDRDTVIDCMRARGYRVSARLAVEIQLSQVAFQSSRLARDPFGRRRRRRRSHSP